MALQGKLVGVFLLSTFLIAQTLSTACADETGWVGQQVALRAGAVLRKEIDSAGTQGGSPLNSADEALQLYRVERAENEKLWLVETVTGLHGWVPLGDAVRLADAIAALNGEIESDPLSAVAYRNRGLLRQRTGDLIQAMADYGAAIRLNPNDAIAHYCRATAHGFPGTIANEP
jgi:tetratricopeptide (TPR) repeat protein